MPISPSAVQICIPTRGHFDDSFAVALMELREYHGRKGEWMPPILRSKGGAVHAGRQQLVEEALKTPGAEAILWLDDDMTFPKDALERLLKHDREFVACNYLNRHTPHTWTARKEGKSITSTGRSGLQRMDMAPLGVALVKMSVYERLPLPWFTVQGRLAGSGTHVEWLNEDVYHSAHLRKHGVELMVDHSLTQEVTHGIEARGGPKGLTCGNTGEEWMKFHG